MNRYLNIDLSRSEVQGNIVPAVISTDNPVNRGTYNEILEHTDEAIKLRMDELPLLVAHDSQDPAIGKVKDFQIGNGQLRANIEFGSSTRAKELLEDIKNKIINGVSVGYRILEKELEGRNLVARSWELFEVSVVGIGADENSGFYRSQTKEKIMNTENSIDTVKEERSRCSEITEIGKRFNHEEDANSAIASGESLDSFRTKVLDNVQSRAVATPFVKEVGDSQREYSLINALNGLSDSSKRGYEHEISQDLSRTQKRQNSDSIIIPLDTRVMSSGTAGASTIQTSVDSKIQDFIQAQSISMNLGAQMFRLASDDLLIPKGTSASGATVMATDGTTQSAETTPTLGNITLSPKYFADVIPVSYKFLQQSSPDVENYLRRLIGSTFASTLDNQFCGGSGSGGNIKGLFNSSIGTTAISSGAPTFAKIMDSISAISTANVPTNNLNMLMHPGTLTHMVTAVKYSGTASPLLDMVGDGESDGNVGSVQGIPTWRTTNMQANKFVTGDFSHSAWAFWGGLEISVNPYYDDRRFTQSFNAILGADFKVINASAFNIMTA